MTGFGQRPSDPAARKPLQSAHPEQPSTLDEELLGADIASVVSTETDETRVERMSKELEAGFETLRDVKRGVSILGSARTHPEHPDYRMARETARLLGEAGFSIITGGGPGAMAAANRGAREAGALSVGLRIDLPYEQNMNPWVDLEIDHHYFFVRKVMFVRYASAFVVLPGGFGTLDELFEALTLIQTRKVRNFPVILFGTPYWAGLLAWLRDTVLAEDKVSPDDLELLIITDSPERAVQAIVDCFNDECWKVQDDAAKRVLAELADDPRLPPRPT
jgi:uncharacterized protein (TIGR00730 family)